MEVVKKKQTKKKTRGWCNGLASFILESGLNELSFKDSPAAENWNEERPKAVRTFGVVRLMKLLERR